MVPHSILGNDYLCRVLLIWPVSTEVRSTPASVAKLFLWARLEQDTRRQGPSPILGSWGTRGMPLFLLIEEIYCTPCPKTLLNSEHPTQLPRRIPRTR